MTDETEDQNKKARDLRENFAKAMTKEEPMGIVLSMEAFLMRRFAKQNERAKEFMEQAEKVNAGHLSELKNDPFAAPVLRLARQEADKANLTRNHIIFIQMKEEEARRAAVQQMGVNIRMTPKMGWGIPSLGPANPSNK